MALLEIFKFLSCHLRPEFALIGSEVWFARVFLIPSGLENVRALSTASAVIRAQNSTRFWAIIERVVLAPFVLW
jgi:hypothetical protein